jgi:hypothetical protein
MLQRIGNRNKNLEMVSILGTVQTEPVGDMQDFVLVDIELYRFEYQIWMMNQRRFQHSRNGSFFKRNFI